MELFPIILYYMLIFNVFLNTESYIIVIFAYLYYQN